LALARTRAGSARRALFRPVRARPGRGTGGVPVRAARTDPRGAFHRRSVLCALDRCPELLDLWPTVGRARDLAQQSRPSACPGLVGESTPCVLKALVCPPIAAEPRDPALRPLRPRDIVPALSRGTCPPFRSPRFACRSLSLMPPSRAVVQHAAEAAGRDPPPHGQPASARVVIASRAAAP
jgi:hypothetical protein